MTVILPNENTFLPKIGIRPAIDGRRNGVRESLEDTTMGLANLVADFLSANLRHSNGKPVECVVADTCIGGVAEAAQAAQKFSRAGVGVSITVSPCWCYGSETMDMDPFIPKAVWGFNGTERPGAVYLAAVLAAYNQKGIPAFSIYGRDVKDAGDQRHRKAVALCTERVGSGTDARPVLFVDRWHIHGDCRLNCGSVIF